MRRTAFATLLAVAFALALAPPARAGGDFNGDGFDDAAIAAPFDPVLGAPTGSVSVLYGSGAGFGALSAPPSQLLTAFHFGLVPRQRDDFGAALAIGDFDGDGFGDLAIGIPGRELASFPDAGAVGVVHGTPFGLDLDRVQLWTQASRGVKDEPEPAADVAGRGDELGCGLAAGDFDGDGRDDLAIGACGEDVGAVENAGAVHVLRGTKKGLKAKKNQLWTREALLGSGAESGLLGDALAAGDFDGDGFDDLAMGGWLTRTEGFATGAVDVLRGSKKGLAAAGHLPLDPVTLLGVDPDSFFFGNALAAGDFDGDGADDLAIGAPGTDVAAVSSAGAAHVVYGATGGGLDVATVESWDEVAVPTGAFGSFDQLGSSLAAGDFDSDGRDDLAIGIPFADVAGLGSAGEALVLRGGPGGLTALAFEAWSQDAMDVGGAVEASDFFGYALAAGDYDGDGAVDVLVGCPGEAVGTVGGAGAVIALYGDEGGSGLTATGNDVLSRGGTVDSTDGLEGVPLQDASLGRALAP